MGMLQRFGGIVADALGLTNRGYAPTQAVDENGAPKQPLPPPADAAPVREAYGTTIDDDDEDGKWRPLTGDTLRDLMPVTQMRMQKVAAYLWEGNLLANRLVELVVAYLLAEGVRLTVKDEERQKLLNAFWRDPINSMALKLPEKVRELELFGEQCYPTFVNETTGFVRLGYLDPCMIENVITDPDNPSQPIGVVTRPDRKSKRSKFKVIVNGDDADLFTARTQQIRTEDFPDGECFYFRINNLAAGKRGRSSLLAPADWLDSYDEFLFGEMDRAKFMRAFFWDVTLTDASPEAVEKRAKEISAPPPGSVRVHNDSEVWKAESADLKANDSDVHARMFRNHVLGGNTVPETWFGGGGDVNRSTAESMGEPTFKVFSMRQGQWKIFLEEIARYVIRQDAKAKSNSAEPDWEDPAWNPVAMFPELTAKDTTKWAAALQQVMASLVAAIGQGLVTKATAVRMVAAISGRLGVEIDPEEELKKALAEQTKKQEQDVFTGDPAVDDPAVGPGGPPIAPDGATSDTGGSGGGR